MVPKIINGKENHENHLTFTSFCAQDVACQFLKLITRSESTWVVPLLMMETLQTLESEQLGCKARFHCFQAVWNVHLWLFPQHYNGGDGVCLWFCYNWRKVKVLVAQSCLTLCDSMDCSLLGSSVHGILLERILEWVAMPFSRGSSWPRDWTWVSCIAGRFFTVWATEKACNWRDGVYEVPST